MVIKADALGLFVQNILTSSPSYERQEMHSLVKVHNISFLSSMFFVHKRKMNHLQLKPFKNFLVTARRVCCWIFQRCLQQGKGKETSSILSKTSKLQISSYTNHFLSAHDCSSVFSRCCCQLSTKGKDCSIVYEIPRRFSNRIVYSKYLYRF